MRVNHARAFLSLVSETNYAEWCIANTHQGCNARAFKKRRLKTILKKI